MKNPARAIEWSALRYEAKRMVRLNLTKYMYAHMAWNIPVRTSLLYGLSMFGIMLFLSMFLYGGSRMWCLLVIPAALAIGRFSWAERSPLFKDSPAEFMATCGFSALTWYQASLLYGLLKSVLIGLVFAAISLYLLSRNSALPITDADCWIMASLPVVSGLFFLLQFSCEQSRRLIALPLEKKGKDGKELPRVIVRKRPPQLMGVLAFSFLINVVVCGMGIELVVAEIVGHSHFMIPLFFSFVVICLLIDSIKRVRGKWSAIDIYGFLIVSLFTLFIWIFILLWKGSSAWLGALFLLHDYVPPMLVFFVVSALFLVLAWKAGRRSAGDLVRAGDSIAMKEVD